MTQLTVQKLRKDLKELGYKLTIKTYSFGAMADVKHTATGYSSGSVLPAELWHEVWDKWVEYKTKNREAILALDIPGLRKNTL